MPDISSYIKINEKNVGINIAEVNYPKPDGIGWKNMSLCGLILFSCLITGIFKFYTVVVRSTSDSQGFETQWQYYKMVHGKNYSQEEDQLRMSTFLENMKEIEYHNSLVQDGIESYEKGINMFSDLTLEELDGIKCFHGDLETFPPEEVYQEAVFYPSAFDWRLKGVVTEVKNQKLCGSCYAFSAAGSLEAQHFLKTGELVSLSEQNLVDCSTPQGNKGCEGGTMNNAFQYILQNKGIDTEQSYPYEGKEDVCRFKPSAVGATLRGYRRVLPLERALQAAVVGIGPISVGIHATPDLFHYKSGIFADDSCSPYSLNHAVLVVGFGSELGQDFWIVKNSWGTGWGENGYFRMARNKGNMCGIASMASYPVV